LPEERSEQLEEWSRKLLSGESYGETLLSAARKLQPVELEQVFKDGLNEVFSPETIHALPVGGYQAAHDRITKLSRAFVRLYVGEGWGRRPEEARMFGDFMAVAAAKPLMEEGASWRGVGDDSSNSAARWAFSVRLVPVASVAWALADQPQLARSRPKAAAELLVGGLADAASLAASYAELEVDDRNVPTVAYRWNELKTALPRIFKALDALAGRDYFPLGPENLARAKSALESLGKNRELPKTLRGQARTLLSRVEGISPNVSAAIAVYEEPHVELAPMVSVKTPPAPSRAGLRALTVVLWLARVAAGLAFSLMLIMSSAWLMLAVGGSLLGWNWALGKRDRLLANAKERAAPWHDGVDLEIVAEIETETNLNARFAALEESERLRAPEEKPNVRVDTPAEESEADYEPEEALKRRRSE
jgi:hypothetical protein